MSKFHIGQVVRFVEDIATMRNPGFYWASSICSPHIGCPLVVRNVSYAVEEQHYHYLLTNIKYGVDIGWTFYEAQLERYNAFPIQLPSDSFDPVYE